MKKHLTDSVSFDFVRYANVWEDAEILLAGLDLPPGKRILSIASAGDNCFQLLKTDPEIVVAADLNPAQFHLIELKMAAIRRLDYLEVLSFLGFREMENRLEIFKKLKNDLSPAARNFWENKPTDLKNGVIHSGKFERYFQMFARRVLPFIHSKNEVEKLLSPKTPAEQVTFYREKWNTWRWRLLFKIFFSRWVMGKFGRDPQFLAQVETSVAERILKKAEQHLENPVISKNHILRYNLTGSFGHLLPDYLQPENFETIKNRLDRIQFFHGFAQDAGQKFGKFDAMNLSDIFEYMDLPTFAAVSDALLKIANPGCRLAYWNLLVPRRISEIDRRATFLEEISTQLTARDRGFFYDKFIVDQK